jgi:hypothetical protein
MNQKIMSGYSADRLKDYKVRASCGHVEVRKMREGTAGVPFDPTAEFQIDAPRGMPCRACVEAAPPGESAGSIGQINRLRKENGAVAATRVASIGYPGEKGLTRAKEECTRRERELASAGIHAEIKKGLDNG